MKTTMKEVLMTGKPEEGRANQWLASAQARPRNCKMCGGYGYWGARDESCPACQGTGYAEERRKSWQDDDKEVEQDADGPDTDGIC